MKYYYANADNKTAGPVELTEIEKLVASAALKPDPMVFPEHGGEWQRLSAISKQAPALPTVAPAERIDLPTIESAANQLPFRSGGRDPKIPAQHSLRRTSPPMNDADKMIRYEANKKSLLVGYLLLWFVGYFGGHRFYFGRKETAIAQLVITIVSIPLLFIFIGFFPLMVVGIWCFIDLFLLPGICREYNNRLADSLAYGVAVPA